jgi:predicted nucleotidyltransferase component of viral defense system
MDPSRDHRISVHEDHVFFREAVLFTAGQTGLNATLIEKDYFCTILLQYLYQQPDSPLIFRGGTCIGKVYTDFYRLSEDLDFMISTQKEKLKTQTNTERKPVLRPVDFDSFDLDSAFDIVARMSHLLR